jgi:hypothetical protein
MPRFRPGDLTVVLIAGVAMAALVVVAGTGAAPAAPAIDGSSYSTGRAGAKAAFLALEQLGYDVERSFEPVASITGDPSRLTLVIASPMLPPSEQDKRALRTFMEAGGRVLVTGVVGADFLAGTVTAPGPDSDREPESFGRIAEGPLTADAATITMSPDAGGATLPDAYEGAYGDPSNAVVRSAPIGAGLAVWWAGATPLTNGAIATADNLPLFLNSVGEAPRRVLWDEHYHGHSRSLWSYFVATPLPWAGVQLLLIGAASILTFSRRPGPVRGIVVDPRTSPMEFVETMGSLYERAGAARAAVDTARNRLVRLLASAAGIAPDAPDQQIAAAAARRAGIDREAVLEVLEASRRELAHPADGLRLVQRIQAMAHKVVKLSGRP